MTRFLAWFDREAPARPPQPRSTRSRRWKVFAATPGSLKDVSFPTIAGAGAQRRRRATTASPGAATAVSRRANSFSSIPARQYEDGTTDITRTIAVGAPGAEMRGNFTRVLKGHIAIARASVSRGTTGAQLNSFARQYLWQAGLDFDHGTGHGVGSYLSVHEGPARISKLGSAALKRGMILSNEPGYYRTGAYGIRIENLVLVARGAAGGRRRKSRSTPSRR